MKTVWILLLVLILLCLLIFITRLSIRVMAAYAPGDVRLHVQVRFWFIRYTLDVPAFLKKRKAKQAEGKAAEKTKEQAEKTDRSVSEWLEKLPELIKTAGDIHTIIKGFLRKIKVKKFEWITHFGTGDAAATGIASGGIWSVKGIVAGFLANYMQVVRAPELQVHPVFQGKVTATQLDCTVSFQIGQAMIAGLKLFRYIRRHRSVFVAQTEEVQQHT
ncbi:DUF2953 domain-containing protein [Ectobacillus ponti]|uniref:DUF2953 domain-containing protein n=1 Tax=Ectobacillus ponti TaxID=2961894 RepID=A0AA41X5B1_9BACI|nr:DUF2953 domain-containing protein [Ectobacillus ponti]MCP8967458.1 DUF2953 domain-containing protein [Ectobacillus ponti]